MFGRISNIMLSPAETPYAGGDRVVLYTDGIIECRNSSGEFFEMERFKNLIADTAALNPESAIKRFTQADEEWRGVNSETEVDITLIGVNLK